MAVLEAMRMKRSGLLTVMPYMQAQALYPVNLAVTCVCWVALTAVLALFCARTRDVLRSRLIW